MVWSCNVSVSQHKFYIYIKKISINLIDFDSIHDMKTPNEKYRLRILKKKNQSVLNLEQNQRILKNYFKVSEYWPCQRTLISFSKYINFVPNLTQF